MALIGCEYCGGEGGRLRCVSYALASDLDLGEREVWDVCPECEGARVLEVDESEPAPTDPEALVSRMVAAGLRLHSRWSRAGAYAVSAYARGRLVASGCGVSLGDAVIGCWEQVVRMAAIAAEAA